MNKKAELRLKKIGIQRLWWLLSMPTAFCRLHMSKIWLLQNRQVFLGDEKKNSLKKISFVSQINQCQSIEDQKKESDASERWKKYKKINSLCPWVTAQRKKNWWTIEVCSAEDSWQMKILGDIDELLMRQETELSAPFAWYKLKTIYYRFKNLRNLFGLGKICVWNWWNWK